MKPIKKYLHFFVFTTLALSLVIPGFIQKNPSLHAQDTDAENVYYFPYFVHYVEILPSTSYYLPTADQGFLYNLGCEQGMRDNQAEGVQDGVVVLDFSYPVCNAEGDFFGADLFQDRTEDGDTDPVSTNVIGAGVKQFALGYYNCSASDTESNLVVGVGTNNKDLSCDTEEKAVNHGQAWAEMVSDINQWALTQGILHQVQAYGASDIELSWNSPVWSRAWVDGFDQGGDNFMLHFGDAAGCAYDGHNLSCGTSAYPEWTQEDVWYVSWGAPPALPLPLIYLTSGVHAQQWASLSRYSAAEHGFRMDITGVFTQWQYCQQFPDYVSACPGKDNSPTEAYLQLSYELNKNPQTAQSLRWKADIRWIHQSEPTSASTVYEGDRDSTEPHPVYEQIEMLSDSLEEPSLSPALRTSLDRKLQNYLILIEKIETSRRAPAQKLPMTQSYLDLLQSSD